MNKRQAKKKRKKSKAQLIFHMWPEKIEEYWNKASRMHVEYARRMYIGMLGLPKTDELKALCEAAEKIVSDVLKNEIPEETARQIKIFKRTVYGNKADEIILDDLIDPKVRKDRG